MVTNNQIRKTNSILSDSDYVLRGKYIGMKSQTGTWGKWGGMELS